MGRPRNPDRPCRVTIDLSKSLLNQLEKEVPTSEKKSLSALIVSKIAYAVTSRPISDKNLTIIAELKPGTRFADVLKQLQVMENSLQVTHISGNLDFTCGHKGTVETVILPNVEPAAPQLMDVNMMLIEDLKLPRRAERCLGYAHITTVGQLRQKTVRELLRIPDFGLPSLRACQAKLLALGIEVKWTG